MTRFVLAATLGVAIVAATALPAAAAPNAATENTPPGSLAAIQASAQVVIPKRVAALQTASTRVSASEYLTDAHQTTIEATFAADIAGLEALESTILADTDRAVAASHYTQIFTDYRVYAVTLPQSAYAAAADAITEGALPALETTYAALEAALEASDKSTAELEATLADLRSQIDAAGTAITGVADSALAATPAEWNTNHETLADERAAVATARAALRQARADAHTIVGALR